MQEPEICMESFNFWMWPYSRFDEYSHRSPKLIYSAWWENTGRSDTDFIDCARGKAGSNDL